MVEGDRVYVLLVCIELAVAVEMPAALYRCACTDSAKDNKRSQPARGLPLFLSRNPPYQYPSVPFGSSRDHLALPTEFVGGDR